MAIIIQPPKNSSGKPQPMVYDDSTGKIIVDNNGYILNGENIPLINIPSKLAYVNTPKTTSNGINEASNYAIANKIPDIKFNEFIYSQNTNATTSGSVTVNQVDISPAHKKVIITLNAYENDTTTNQTIDYPMAFTSHAVVTGNTSGLTVTAGLSNFTLTSSDDTTAYTGMIIIEGY